MDRRIWFSVLLMLLFQLPTAAQSIDEIRNDRGTWLYGEGSGTTQRAADDAALKDLIQQISVTVKSDFMTRMHERAVGSEIESEREFEALIQSYSTATLNNTRRMLVKQEPDAVVIRYIRNSEIDKIFKEREAKIHEFVRLGDDALGKLQIDDALRYYYWSLCLVRSLRYPNEARITVDGREQMLYAYLPSKIEEVCADVNLSARKVSASECELTATYKGNPIRSMDYTYNCGDGFGSIYSVRDGRGIIETFDGQKLENVQVKIEYEFRDIMVDHEVAGIIGTQSDIFKKAYSNVRLGDETKPIDNHAASAVGNAASQSSMSAKLTAKIAMDTKDMKQFSDRIGEVHAALLKHNPSAVRELFTADGYEELNTILSYGDYTVGKDLALQCFQDDRNGKAVVCRGLQCLFRFGKSRTFNEQITFTFVDGKIDHVALGLGKQMAEEEVLGKDGWSEQARKQIISFLEDYRTAYATKDIDYMERVFDDNAVIIVGKKLKAAPNLNDKYYMNNERVIRTRYTKQEFIRNLRRSFKSKAYINLHFSNCEVVKLGGDDRYGIQVKQDYYSDNYGDTGYLYLLVDLTNPKLPIIHVRTWQEQPDPDFGVIKAGDW